MGGLNKLHNRIMLPFLALFLVINIVPLALNRYYIGKLVDERIAVQTDRISRLISNWEFVLNPAYLTRLRNVIDSDIIVYDKKDHVAASTLTSQLQAHLVSQVSPREVRTALEGGGEPLFQKTVRINQGTFMLTARPLGQAQASADKMMLWVVSPMSDAQEAKSSLTGQMGLICLAGIFITIFFGHLIAKSVTRPVGNLVSVTHKLAEGQFDHKASLPSVQELRYLAMSINTMSERLAGFEKQVALSSRLAAAGKVTAAMSHEIRNPLSSIKMLAQLLRDKTYLSEQDRKIIKSMLEEIIRVERIVSDHASLARPAKIECKSNDINALINDVIAVALPKLTHRKVHAHLDLKPELPMVSLDQDKVKQVLWNLLLNAMESMPEGGAVEIRTDLDVQLRRILVSVEDEGCGLNIKNPEEAFTPFYSTKPEGLGLGLSTSREIMIAHGGRLLLKNRDGGGTCAEITFPVSD